METKEEQLQALIRKWRKPTLTRFVEARNACANELEAVLANEQTIHWRDPCENERSVCGAEEKAAPGEVICDPDILKVMCVKCRTSKSFHEMWKARFGGPVTLLISALEKAAALIESARVLAVVYGQSPASERAFVRGLADIQAAIRNAKARS
jgi:hypothetical protein